MNKKDIKMVWVAGIIGIIILAISFFTIIRGAEVAQIGGQINGYQCTAVDNRWKVEEGDSATLPGGYSFEQVIVKAGQDCKLVYPTNNFSDCYEVELEGQTVTVNKVGDGKECKDVSHLEGLYKIDPTPTATASATPSGTPTGTPTSTPVSSPTPQESPSTTPEATTLPVLLAETGSVKETTYIALMALGLTLFGWGLFKSIKK